MNLKFSGALYSCGGYARIRHILLELVRHGLNIKTVPFHIYDQVKFKDYDQLKQLELNQLTSKYINLTCGIPLQFKREKEAFCNIGYTMFEANALPEMWSRLCNQMDEIWVPSTWNETVFKLSHVTVPIKVVPLGIDPMLFYSDPIIHNNFNFVFLSVGTYIDRKGWDILLEAFAEEFFNDNNIHLIVKLDGSNCYAEQEIRNLVSLSNLTVINELLDDDIMNQLYNMSDCFVLATRGEAFCLPALESLACRKPVLITEGGGYTDFLNDDNAWFIKSKYTQISSRLGKINPYYRNLWFLEPDKEDLKNKMRLIVTNNQKIIGSVSKYYYDNISILVSDYLKEKY